MYTLAIEPIHTSLIVRLPRINTIRVRFVFIRVHRSYADKKNDLSVHYALKKVLDIITCLIDVI